MPFKSVKELPAGPAKAGKFPAMVCSVIEVPTFFLPRPLLGSDGPHRGPPVRPCVCLPLVLSLLLLFQNYQALARPSFNRKLSFLPDCLQLPLHAVLQPMKGLAPSWSEMATEQQAA